ncbi:MAG TPA: aminotransferase class I/II-fold pyridoxal phosphate-dependent enzyme, partial [Solirubrobacter sp.]|nr:aminotransferase class I/II-fold pyridoxal phosphate-dependent enzyme [Solirubrobacter sp.]
MAISPPAAAPVARRLAGTRSSPVRDLLALASQPHIISLAGGLPAPETFDVDGLKAAFDAVVGVRALQYSSTEGDRALRVRLAGVMAAQGLPATADELLVTTGSQQALGLVATALCDPGDTVLVEDPTYLAALQTFALADVKAHPIPGDEHGP